MKAAFYQARRELDVRETPDPEPGQNEVLVRVAACGICGTDHHIYEGDFFPSYPLIVIYKRVGLFDSRLGMILLYAAFNLPLVIWMMRSFFADLPKEILEAATVDGAGFLRIMWRIVLPLTAPGLAATALLSLIFSWNEFLLAVNLTSANSGTLPVFISSFMTSEGLFYAKMSAASTMAVAPVILAGWLAQRSLVRGLTFGAVK